MFDSNFCYPRESIFLHLHLHRHLHLDLCDNQHFLQHQCRIDRNGFVFVVDSLHSVVLVFLLQFLNSCGGFGYVVFGLFG